MNSLRWLLADPAEIMAAAVKMDAKANSIRGNRVVPTNNGPIELEVKTGKINQHAREAFSHGQCHSLALALHHETGWPIFGIGARADTVPSHFIVFCPDLDTYVDIEGPGAEKRNAYQLKLGLAHYTPEKITLPVMEEYFFPVQTEIAAPFAKIVLAGLVPLAKKGATRQRKPLTLT